MTSAFDELRHEFDLLDGIELPEGTRVDPDPWWSIRGVKTQKEAEDLGRKIADALGLHSKTDKLHKWVEVGGSASRSINYENATVPPKCDSCPNRPGA